MTPEEIEELRALVGRLGANAYDKNLAVVLGAALEHIDQQATRIAELESQIIQQTGISASRMEERERLQKQIAALQKIAVEELAEQIYPYTMHPYTMPSWEHLPEEDYRENIIKKTVIAPGKKTYREAAEMQLRTAHPEAFR